MNILTNQLEDSWRKRLPSGKRPKLTNIPFNGVLGKPIRAMGTKRVPVIPNRLFSSGYRNLDIGCLSALNMASTANFVSAYSSPLGELENVSYDDRINPAYYNQPPIYSSVGGVRSNPSRYELERELQTLRRDRASESRELIDLRQRDLARKRLADQRKSYRAYGLDSSKEIRGWLREAKAVKQAARDSRKEFNIFG